MCLASFTYHNEDLFLLLVGSGVHWLYYNLFTHSPVLFFVDIFEMSIWLIEENGFSISHV